MQQGKYKGKFLYLKGFMSVTVKTFILLGMMATISYIESSKMVESRI